MSIETDYATLRRVIHENQPTLTGKWAAEFGVYSGYSLGIIANHMPVIGFDSFEGLPEDWREGFPAGTFWADDDDVIGGVMRPNAMVVKGWFADTLPEFPFPPLGLVHIDCDLYSSTVTVLEAIAPYVDIDTIIVFDEYHSYPGSEDHEEKAFVQWCAKYGVTVEQIALGEGENAQEAAFMIHDIADDIAAGWNG